MIDGLNDFLLKYLFFSPVMMALASMLYISRIPRGQFDWGMLVMFNLAGLGLLFIFALATGIFLSVGNKN